jgi:hypothetical protein
MKNKPATLPERSEEQELDEPYRAMTGTMNPLGRWLIVEVLGPEGILFRRSEAHNSITIENPADWIRLVAWFSRRAKLTELPAYLRPSSQSSAAEIAVMISDGDFSVRLRTFDDVARVIARHASSAFRSVDGRAVLDPRALPTDLTEVTRDFASLDPVGRRIS